MNKSAVGFVLFLFITSCTSGRKTTTDRADNQGLRNISYPCQQERYDVSVAGIKINDAESVDKTFGDVQDDTWRNEEGDLSYTLFNEDENQSLMLIFHPGGLRNQFAEFEIKYGKYRKTNRETNTKFISDQSIRLGMSKNEVTAKLGECYKVEKSQTGNIKLMYRIDDVKSSELLQKYNMPEYYTECEFKNDKLIRYRFGFHYP